MSSCSHKTNAKGSGLLQAGVASPSKVWRRHHNDGKLLETTTKRWEGWCGCGLERGGLDLGFICQGEAVEGYEYATMADGGGLSGHHGHPGGSYGWGVTSAMTLELEVGEGAWGSQMSEAMAAVGASTLGSRAGPSVGEAASAGSGLVGPMAQQREPAWVLAGRPSGPWSWA